MNLAADVIGFLTDNMNKFFFPEEWLALDMKFSKSELLAMLVLSSRGELTMSELAEIIHVPLSTATGLVDRLVRNQYLKRDRRDDDRRIVVLKLTDKGQGINEAYQRVMSRYITLITDELTEEEQQFLLRIVLKVFKAMQTESEAEAGSGAQDGKLRTITIE